MVPLKNSWAFPVIEAAHLAGVALLAGAAVLTGARRLGFRVVPQTADELVRFFKPWAHGGLGIALLTGIVMTAADWDRYLHNPAFRVKIALVVAALISYFAPPKSKTAAVLSIALWTAVVLAARAIADFDI